MSRDLKLISASMLAWGLGEGIFLIFQPLYMQEFGATPVMIGTILGINGVMMTLFQIPAGYLADKIGIRPVLWFNWVIGVVATWMMALAPSLGVFMGGLLLYGVTLSVMGPLNAYVQGVRGKWSIGRAISFSSAAYNFGGILGPIIGGAVAETFNLRTAYFVAGVIFTISTIIIFFTRDLPRTQEVPAPGETHLFRNKRFMGMLVIFFLVVFAITLPQPLAANFLQNERSLPLNQIGQLGSLAALGSVLIMLIFGNLPAGMGMLIGQLSLMVFSAALWLGTNFFWYGLAFVFQGGFRLSRAMTVTLARPVVREREVSLAFGVVETFNSLALIAAPVAAGFLYDWRPISIFPVGLAVLALTSILTIRFTRRNGQHALAGDEINGIENEVRDEA